MKYLSLIFILFSFLSCNMDELMPTRVLSNQFCKDFSNTEWHISRIEYQSKDSISTLSDIGKIIFTDCDKTTKNKIVGSIEALNQTKEIRFNITKTVNDNGEISVSFQNSRKDDFLKIGGVYKVIIKNESQLTLTTEASLIEGKIVKLLLTR